MFVLIPIIQIENYIFPFKIVGKRVHVDILFTAHHYHSAVADSLSNWRADWDQSYDRNILTSRFFCFFFIPLSVHMVRPTNPAYGYETTETIFFLEKKKPCLCAAKRSFLIFFVIRKLKFDLLLRRRSCARDACVPCAKGLSRDTRVKASIEALEEHMRTARCPGRGSRAHLTAA